ncbi:DUF2298 domain-containing protein [Halapricum hydrolyticum]|uniref:DUF2298 domain-containing protein n=1 Tax=Halapricum hydrolyticum TaxID=2979991 RepID=A0AAE3I9V3_9EURY|nr:DUF2298 domain-containing protein [Halapricum hydrolyticum]MCU4717280.1 DUF2298 domain-containing protein [Halapricum hydrolyticum]MCU4726207.1 DUF2298 domain-containing protein [Halapricum hydrolyticum]
MEYGLVALWLVTYLLLLYLGQPLAHALLPDFEDRGAALALPLGLAVVWLVVFALGRVSIQFGLWIGLLVLAGLSAVAVYRGFEVDHDAYVRTALVFAVAFLFLVAIRAVDPAASPGGGEKFLDMSLLQSSLRGSTIPPEDAWFAGETVRYYYGGHLLASLLARLTGTTGRFAYNLALSGYYAMLVTAAYGLAGSIAAHRDFSYRRAGIGAAFFVGFASNLLTPLRFGGALLDAVAARVGPLGAIPSAVARVWEAFAGLLLPLPREYGIATSISEFHYWSASRVLEGAITEFPLFAWLNGDLHAHMMNTPFLLAVAAVLFQVFVAGTDRSRRRTLATVFGLVPALGAVIAVVNSWSFPAIGGLTILALALAPDRPISALFGRNEPVLNDSGSFGRPLLEARTLAVAIVAGGVVLVLAWLLSAPYWLVTASSTGSPAVFPDRSTLAELLVTHGAFLVLFWLSLYRYSHPSVSSRGALAAVVVLLVAMTTVIDVAAVGLFGPLILVGWVLLRDDRRPDVDVVGSTDGPTRPGFETVLLVAAAGLIVLVEFVYLQDGAISGRFNTVFKVYMQAWVLASVAAGVVLTRLLDDHHPALGLSGPRWRQGFRAGTAVLVGALSLYGLLALAGHFGLYADATSGGLLSGVPVWLTLAAFLLVVALVGWPALAGVSRWVPPDREGWRAGGRLAIGLLVVSAGFVGGLALVDAGNDVEPTMDALAFVESDHPREAGAIYWLDGDVDGQPNMVSHPGQQYRWDNAPASLTGVPTVVGKPPEAVYRGEDVYRQRVDDVRTIFIGQPAEQRRLLSKYDVELIYVGPDERSNYETITVDELDEVSVEKQWPAVTVYRVNRTALDET